MGSLGSLVLRNRICNIHQQYSRKQTQIVLSNLNLCLGEFHVHIRLVSKRCFSADGTNLGYLPKNVESPLLSGSQLVLIIRIIMKCLTKELSVHQWVSGWKLAEGIGSDCIALHWTLKDGVSSAIDVWLCAKARSIRRDVCQSRFARAAGTLWWALSLQVLQLIL